MPFGNVYCTTLSLVLSTSTIDWPSLGVRSALSSRGERIAAEYTSCLIRGAVLGRLNQVPKDILQAESESIVGAEPPGPGHWRNASDT